jgi:cbb3-type cytochrome oxidase subunit 3
MYTSVFWIILAILFIVVIVYFFGNNKKRKRVITESTEQFPENKSTPRSAP